MRLQVDPIACDGFGYCAELAPEHITLDQWGYPMLDPRPLPPASLAVLRQAVRACPRKALRLVPVTGPDREPR